MSKVSIIIPFLNEEENLPHLLSQLESKSDEWDFETELVLVNDGSTDDSLSQLEKYEPKHFDLQIISLSKNFGSHAALRAGIKVASGDVITFLYADLQDPPETVPLMLAEIRKGKDVVWGHREKAGKSQGLLAQMTSNRYNKLMQKHVNPNFPERGFDIVMFTNKVAEQVRMQVEAHSSIFLQILNYGYAQGSVSYEKRTRERGKSKWTFSKKLKLFIDSFIAFSYFPY